MKRAIIESPFSGDVRRNVAYLRACICDSLMRGEAPIASHALYTQPGILNDKVPEEREQGIEAGYAWWEGAELIVFYEDLGWSNGMRAAWDRCIEMRKPCEVRLLGAYWPLSDMIGPFPPEPKP